MFKNLENSKYNKKTEKRILNYSNKSVNKFMILLIFLVRHIQAAFYKQF